MKKLIALSLAAVMALSLVACGNNDGTTTTQTPSSSTSAPETTAPSTTAPSTTAPAEPVKTPESSLAFLEEIWTPWSVVINEIPEDDRPYFGGGDWTAPVEYAPGTVTEKDFMTVNMHLPENATEQVDDVASLYLVVNANSLTVSAYHLVEGIDVAAFAKNFRDELLGVHWMCGFPEKLFIASIGDYVLVGYGLEDYMSSVENYFTALSAEYPAAEVLYNEFFE